MSRLCTLSTSVMGPWLHDVRRRRLHSVGRQANPERAVRRYSEARPWSLDPMAQQLGITSRALPGRETPTPQREPQPDVPDAERDSEHGGGSSVAAQGATVKPRRGPEEAGQAAPARASRALRSMHVVRASQPSDVDVGGEQLPKVGAIMVVGLWQPGYEGPAS